MSDPVPSEAIVRALSGGSAKCGVVAVGLRGLHAGDFVVLRSGPREIYGRVVWHFGRSQPSPGEVRIDQWQREDLGVAVGDAVQIACVPPDQVTALTDVHLSTSAPLTGPDASDGLVDFMARQKFPLYPGFRFEFSPLGTGQTVRCRVERGSAGRQQVSFGICTEQTGLRLRGGGAGSSCGQSDVSYDDIGGLDLEIQTVRETVELPIRMRNVIDRLGVSPPRGIIFYGPPGTGKTLLAKALANGAGVPIFSLSPSELLAKNPAEAEELLNSVFDQAEGNEQGSIILIDELDAVGGKRDGSATAWGGTLVTALLTRLDGLKSRGNVIVIGTTNRLKAIDEALRRHGRFSREIHVAAPDESGRLQILQIHTRRMPLADGSEPQREQLLQDLARQTRGFVGADLMELCREAGLCALKRAHPLEALDRGDLAARATLEITRGDFERSLRVVKPSAMKEVLVSIPDVSFDDVAGLATVIEEIRDRMIRPMQHPEAFAAMQLQLEKGVLLYGPPGTGKTMLAKAIAKECGANFLVVQGPELLSKWFGESEEGVRRVFARARQLAPAIVLFDEIEALLPTRGRHEGDSGAADRVVNQFLAELDGVVELAGVAVIGATNRPELIDQAALRPGRLGTHIRIPLPDEAARQAILSLYAGPQISADALASLAGETQGFSGADLAGICRDAKLIALGQAGYQRAVPVTEAHLLESLSQYRLRRRPR